MENTKLSELDDISKRDFLEKVKNHKLSFKSQIGFSLDMKFGIEIEFRGYDFENFLLNSKNNVSSFDYLNGWILDYDESLPLKTGRELISPIITDTKENWEALRSILSEINLFVKNARVDEKCSNHIHFDADLFDKNPELIYSFMVLLAEVEPVLTRFYSGEFLNLRYYADEYAREFTPLLLSHMPIDKSSYGNLLNSLYDNKGYKTHAFDFSRLYQNNLSIYMHELNTFENRLPNGTLNSVIVQNNVMLMGYLIEYILKGNYDYEKALCKIDSFDRDVSAIYDDLAFYVADFLPNDELKLDFLKQYYKDGSTLSGRKLKKSLDFF